MKHFLYAFVGTAMVLLGTAIVAYISYLIGGLLPNVDQDSRIFPGFAVLLGTMVVVFLGYIIGVQTFGKDEDKL